jgi:hypothetical protein
VAGAAYIYIYYMLITLPAKKNVDNSASCQWNFRISCIYYMLIAIQIKDNQT